jgi:hypothetical protein
MKRQAPAALNLRDAAGAPQENPSLTSLRTTARQALMLIAAAAPDTFVTAITRELSRSSGSIGEEGSVNVLRVVRAMLKRKPHVLFPQLPRIAEAVVSCLDPHREKVRQASQTECTLIFRDMVERFRSVCFHAQSQKLAVGSTSGRVVVLDLTTATRSVVFEAHADKNIIATEFSREGKYIATLSSADRMLRVWNLSSGFSMLLSGSPKMVREMRIEGPLPGTEWTNAEVVNLVWIREKAVSLARRDQDTVVLAF